MDKQAVKLKARGFLNPIVSALGVLGVPPLLVSLLGVGLSIYGAVLLADGRLFYAGLVFLAAGLCDVIDGSLARSRNVASRFGAFIDSTFDRIAEFACFAGILIYLVERPQGYGLVEFLAAFVALTGSILTSYTRARAEGLGLHCTVGLLERPERIALMVLGLLLGRYVLFGVLVVLAVATMLTSFQRIYHVYKLTRDDPPQS
jgi:CDP-diacylglycerol--glycerol-3-phosphate 3-phosphatidyltransferase